jgi:hypothetical protein
MDVTFGIPSARGCSSTEPGHAANLTGVKLARWALRTRPGAGRSVRVQEIVGPTVVLELVDRDADGACALTVRCHATNLLAVARTDRAVGTLVEEQHLLLLPARPDEGGTFYLTDDGAIRAVNVALEGHPFVSCALAARLDGEEVG